MQKRSSYFVEPSELVRNTLCYADGIGICDDADFCINREFFDNFVVMYIVEGCLCHEQCGRKIEIRSGEYIFADLRMPHRYYFEGESLLYWTHINGKTARELSESIGLISPLPVKGDNEAIHNLLCECFSLAGKQDFYKMSCKLYEMMTEILKDIQANCYNQRKDEKQKAAFQLEESLKEFIYQPADLQKIAQSMNMSKYHLCHISTSLLGVGPIKKLNIEKIKTACRHLQYTNEKIEAISLQLCFSSLSYFSKVFKAQMGISPAVYRKISRQTGKNQE